MPHSIYSVFEPDEDDKNEKEYKKIHEDYKNLVDFMLGSYMEDIGITPQQFEEACGKGSKRSFQHGLFEQVLLVEVEPFQEI